MTEDTVITGSRRHDLDALRAMAMLLGIVLHGALSLSTIPWLVQDDVQSQGMSSLTHIIHVFRMPLFFLLSGYFSMLLWQRRGPFGLFRQRALRIGLPLVVSIFTVLPLMGLSIVMAWGLSESTSTVVQEGPSPLHLAAGHGDADECDRLILAGADLHAGDDRGSTPLHWAIFFGREDVARRLIDAGSSLNIKNRDGRTPMDELYEPWTEEMRGLCQFFAGILNLDIELDEVPAARVGIAEYLGLEPPVSKIVTEGTPIAQNQSLDLGHLWFLWYLVLVTAAAWPLMAVFKWSSARLPSLLASPWMVLFLVPVTASFLCYMMERQSSPLFGPHTSTVLKPDVAIVCFYTLFFAFGALLRLVDPETKRITRRWWAWWPVVVVLFPMTLHATFEPQTSESISWLLPSVYQAALCWALILGLLGCCQRVLQREHRFVRLISDSSYWIYLMHLPLVLVLQGWVSHWPSTAIIKLLVICGITSISLFVSYVLFVRPTPLGWMLNGRKQHLLR